ncbi:hypothetical protein ACIGZJ_26900 [Kitasatospora sp. NPDC052868]|uniref:hypothetical protein n=1 Tax=Kitasatospora sp. NPDC052868 TaxID=3364060 RepID=UPI0037CC5A8A
MGEFATCPLEAVKAAEAICGPVELKEITDRRGSAVWKAVGAGTTVAIKAGYGDGEEITAREAAVLDQLPDYTVTSGRHSHGVWYVTAWLDGPSTWELFKPFRQGSDLRTEALSGAVDLCRAVADLHALGWVHSDLQPLHGVHTDMGARLLDFAWSWHTDFPQHPAFMGGITHLVAPELAVSIHDGERPATPTQAADVYALAGSLWTCTTGTWPLDYAAVGINPKDSTPDSLRAAIATGTVPLDPVEPWPDLQRTLRLALDALPERRPTASALAGLLAALE